MLWEIQLFPFVRLNHKRLDKKLDEVYKASEWKLEEKIYTQR